MKGNFAFDSYSVSDSDSPVKKEPCMGGLIGRNIVRQNLNQRFLAAEDVEMFAFSLEEEANAFAIMKLSENRELRGDAILNVQFSQPTISNASTDEIPLEQIILSMHTKGWDHKLSKGIQCAEMPDGKLVSMDNRRLYCAKQVVEQYQNRDFSMPITICRAPKDCTAVANTLFFQMEKNKAKFMSDLLPGYMNVKQLFSDQCEHKDPIDNIMFKISSLCIDLDKKIICPEQIDNKLEKIGYGSAGETPLWCVYTRMRVFNALIDDKQCGYEETRVNID